MSNLRQLQYLTALAATRNFRRAAELTNATQPTLSGQIKALETRLGCQLIERSKPTLLFTPAGQKIIEIAKRMLADAELIKSLARQGDSYLSGVLRLGVPATLGPYLVPAAVPALAKTFPDLKFHVREALPVDIPDALSDGTFDLAITLLPLARDDLTSTPLFSEPLYLAVSRTHRLARPLADVENKSKAAIGNWHLTPSDLKDEDVLALGPGHQLHEQVVRLCQDFGARLRFDYEGTSLDTLREMVAMGLGVTFLPALYAESAAARDPNIVLRRVPHKSVARTVVLAWRKTIARDSEHKALAKTFCDVAAAGDTICVPLATKSA